MPCTFPYSAGTPRPLGATVLDGGVNFCLFVDRATAVELLLYESAAATEPCQVIRLEHRQHRTVRNWHVFVSGVGPGQCYAWRVHGPWIPSDGVRFDGRYPLLDPYARAIVPRDGDESLPPAAGGARSGRFVSVVSGEGAHGRPRPCTPVAATDRVIYEAHLAGYTRHPSSRVSAPGTFAGLIDKIPYLVDLGITTVELMPIFSFDRYGALTRNPFTGERLVDYWGYNPVGFFAPHHRYASASPDPVGICDELQRLVDALHAAGLELFLDVVYNHTGEGGLDGPIHCFRGVSNHIYYIIKQRDSGEYRDFTGCGNTVNCNHPAVRRLILDSLRFWVTEYGVDGFRFDLASVLSRDEDGIPLDEPPLPWEIEADPTLEHCTLVAEAWDAGGLYQVGRFPGERWCEWNGRFRDDVRRFWRGDANMSGLVARRVLGSPDLYEPLGRQPAQCVNFITCHDGFTLADMVSYSHRHNFANGEQNRDGHAGEIAFNSGVEGPTNDPTVVALRERQQRNLLVTLFVSQGTPMLLAGDEFGRTQQGNNNPWCQDNAISWVDWTLLDRNAPLHRFVRRLIRFRRAHPSLHRARYLLGHDAPEGHDSAGYPRVRWSGPGGGPPSWEPANRLVAWTLTTASDDVAIHIVLNADLKPADVLLPPLPPDRVWQRAIDTSLPAPHDIAEAGEEQDVESPGYRVQAQSAVVFVERTGAPRATTRATQAFVVPESLRGP